MTEPRAPRGPGWWRPLTRPDAWALLALVAIPAAVFGLPAAIGHPALAQDNFIQNFPLRVLSARQLVSGHLPLLNPYGNAGTPLLGGMNAGSFYPMTLLFTIMPAMLAWVLNLIVVYATAGIGMFSLCRWHGARTSAAMVAAVAFAFTGTMMGQLVHLGVIEGFSLLPWLVLTELVAARHLLGIGDDEPWRHHLRSAVPAVVGVAGLWALVGLSGEPRAIAVFELVSATVILVELVTHHGVRRATWKGRGSFLVANVVGAAWGAGISLAQLLPGWEFIKDSERHSVSYFFFGSGSLSPRWSILLVDQDIFGGNGIFGAPHFFAHYNLAEVTSYVGLLAVTALVAFLAHLGRRGFGAERSAYGIYVVLVIVGLFAAWGNYTPLGHLFHALPLFGKTRLQSRNLIVVDLALCALLGWWLDALFSQRADEASLTGKKRWVTAALPGAAAVLFLVALINPALVTQALAVGTSAAVADTERGALVVHLLLALGILWVVLKGRIHISRRLVVGIFLCDLIMFSMLSDVGFATGSTSIPPSPTVSASVIGTQGRYAIVDYNFTDYDHFEALGVPNVNVFTGLKSVQGYGALVSAKYSRVTGTHPLVTINPCHLEAGDFVDLRLDSLLISASTFLYPAGLRDPFPACHPPTRVASVSRFFGRGMEPDQIRLTGFEGHDLSSGSLKLQFFGPTGAPVGQPVQYAGREVTLTLTSPHVVNVAGFTLSASGGLTLGSSAVTELSAPTKWLSLDSSFQDAMSTPHWRLHNTSTYYSDFRLTDPLPPQWLENSAFGTVLHSRTASWGDEWVTVRTEPANTLVRSVAWLSGWRATLTNVKTGQSFDETVQPDGLIQKVQVPPGEWVVHFHYHAPYIEAGLIGTLIAGLLFLVALWWVVRHRVRPALADSLRA